MDLTAAENARIDVDVYGKLLADCAATVLSTRFVLPEVRKGRAATLTKCRAIYDAAESTLKGDL